MITMKTEPKKIASRLRGIPKGMLCRSRDVVAELGISWELWMRWEDSGLNTLDLGSEAELIDTDDLHTFAKSKPTIAPPRRKVSP